jgi:hypothetical protein
VLDLLIHGHHLDLVYVGPISAPESRLVTITQPSSSVWTGDHAPKNASAAALPPSSASMPPSLPEQVVVHPLVLLSVVDHYNRVAKDTKKRVVGVVLGEVYKGKVDATNCFAGDWELCNVAHWSPHRAKAVSTHGALACGSHSPSSITQRSPSPLCCSAL